MTLHEAMRTVLREMPDCTGSTDEICHEIVHRELYVKPNGKALFAEQIFLRARRPTYAAIFEVIDRRTIRLKEDPSEPPKDPDSKPDYRGQRGGRCPKCKRADTVARKSRKTGELYFGCTAPKRGQSDGCNFKGCRTH